jgi:hypothetical protein
MAGRAYKTPSYSPLLERRKTIYLCLPTDATTSYIHAGDYVPLAALPDLEPTPAEEKVRGGGQGRCASVPRWSEPEGSLLGQDTLLAVNHRPIDGQSIGY